ncbi:hypothetical protein A3E63_02660 [Candidatus Giovannonibacteria bacterium RIFCSPHIGHO2_12_FULL_45_19]|nr:MAG: hypothetical protein A3E63_02660 [Candidatus Giovannonibacteria bacterium RIFCSPHIGHO2_12_FULL_45_19]
MLDELKKIGLSENEARVYLALLELGSETAQEIAKKAAVKRATTYVQLEALMKKGLVTSFEKGKKSYFRAEDPEHLIKIAEREKKMATERESALEEILPGLGKLYISSGERPRVRFFEGVEGLRTMQDEFLKTKEKEALGFSSADDILRIFPSHPAEYSPRRVRRGIHSKLIYTSSRGKILKKQDDELLREARYIPADKFPFTCDVAVYGNRVAISALRKNPIGVIIESEEIADSLKTIFNLAWEATEKYN